MNSYLINGKDVVATEDQEEAWQSFRDALDELSNAYGLDYDGMLYAIEPVVCDAISDSLTVQEAA
jgi:hypothetical protein